MKNKMTATFEARVVEARQLFEQERFYAAGKIYCQGFTHAEKVSWAAHIVESLHRLTAPIEAVEQAIELARDEARWKEGYELFQSLRQQGLQLLANPDAQQSVKILSLSEKLTKLIYNATSPSGPFDEDAAEQLVNQVGCEADALLGSRHRAMDLLFPLPS